MFSQNPRVDNFRIIFPDTFFDKDICLKYNEYIKQKPYILNSIQDILQESIKGFETPEFGYTPLDQNENTAGGIGQEKFQASKESEQKLAEKTFDITFRHTDGFLTYFLVLEHFFKKYKMGPGSNRKHIGKFLVEILMPDGITICRLKLDRARIIGVPNLSLDYSTPSRDASTFAVRFGYDYFETTFDLPKVDLK